MSFVVIYLFNIFHSLNLTVFFRVIDCDFCFLYGFARSALFTNLSSILL